MYSVCVPHAINKRLKKALQVIKLKLSNCFLQNIAKQQKFNIF